MIPDPLDKPAIADLALDQLAAGDTQTAVAEVLGVARATVGRFIAANAEELAARRSHLAEMAIEEGERSGRFRSMIVRLLETGAAPDPKSKDDPPAPRDRAQCARVYGEYAGLIGGVRDVTINGDVDARSVSIDARRVAIVQGADIEAIRAESKRLADELGLNA